MTLSFGYVSIFSMFIGLFFWYKCLVLGGMPVLEKRRCCSGGGRHGLASWCGAQSAAGCDPESQVFPVILFLLPA
jgi:hypothetical protein